jgi:hypothetical protein
MGNLFTKEMKCDVCAKQQIEPKYFTRQYIKDDSDLLYSKLDRYDKYGNEINENLQNKEYKRPYFYVCSNGHKIDD